MLGEKYTETIGILGSPRDIGESTLAGDMEDDGISPEDALEGMPEDDEEEVRV